MATDDIFWTFAALFAKSASEVPRASTTAVAPRPASTSAALAVTCAASRPNSFWSCIAACASSASVRREQHLAIDLGQVVVETVAAEINDGGAVVGERGGPRVEAGGRHGDQRDLLSDGRADVAAERSASGSRLRVVLRLDHSRDGVLARVVDVVLADGRRGQLRKRGADPLAVGGRGQHDRRLRVGDDDLERTVDRIASRLASTAEAMRGTVR